MTEQTPNIQHLKKERNRFLAFAYANADILVELTDKLDICYIDGAVSSILRKSKEELEGTSFLELLDKENQQLLANIISNISLDGKLPTSIIQHKNTNDSTEFLMVNGCRLSCFDNHFFLSLSTLKHEKSSQQELVPIPKWVIGKEDFVKEAKEKIVNSTDERAVKLTLFDLALCINLENDKQNALAKKLLNDICEYLQQHTQDGILGHVKDYKFAVLHDDKFEPEKILKAILQYAKNLFGLMLQMPRFETTPMNDLGMTEQDIARVVLYTINQFAEDAGEKFTISTLYDGYKPKLDQAMRELTGFRQTVASMKFDIALQPIVDVTTAEVHHFEALFQFDCMDPFDSTSRFIEFGERAGMISDFDLAMCRKTLDMLIDLGSQGQRPKVAINISGRSLSSDAFRESLKEVLWNYPKVRSQVIVEVTESSKINDIQEVGRFLEELKLRGVKSCIDDFGAGETNYDYIRFMKTDFVKLDGKCIRSALNNQRNTMILKSMISVCQDLGMETIGTDIEDEKSARFLSDWGVKFGQGYHYGKPSADIKRLIPPPIPIKPATKSDEVVFIPPPTQKTTALKPRKFEQNKAWWKKD